MGKYNLRLRTLYRPKPLTRPAATLMFSRMFQMNSFQPTCYRPSSRSCDPFHAPVDADGRSAAFRYCSRWTVSPLVRLLRKFLLEAVDRPPQLRVDSDRDGSCTKNLLLLLIPGVRKGNRRRRSHFAPDLSGPIFLLKPDIVKAFSVSIPSLPVWSDLDTGQPPESTYTPVDSVKAKRTRLSLPISPYGCFHAS